MADGYKETGLNRPNWKKTHAQDVSTSLFRVFKCDCRIQVQAKKKNQKELSRQMGLYHDKNV